ncbi:MAG: hypothetical protein AAF596_09360, partial [Planctomycetota bacterium]
SANALMNAVATRPAAWSVRLRFQNPQGVQQPVVGREPRPRGGERERGVESEQAPSKAGKSGRKSNPRGAADLYRHRSGYTNDAASQTVTEQLLASCPQRTAVDIGGAWGLSAVDQAGESIELSLAADRSEAVTPKGRFWIDSDRPFEEQNGPPGTGGLLVALHAWRVFVTASGADVDRFTAHGETPWGADGNSARRVVRAFDGATVEYYLESEGNQLVAIEAWLRDDADPCRLVFSDFGVGPVALGSDAPGRISVSRGDVTLHEWTLTRFQAKRDRGAEAGLDESP